MVRMRGLRMFVFLVLLGTAEAHGGGPGYRNPQLLLETHELAMLLRDTNVRLLDARPPEQYRAGHLPGAVNLPAPATDDLESNRRGLPLAAERAEELFRSVGVNTSSRVIVYDEQGNRYAARVLYVLEFFGHRRVQVLNGGIRKWRSEGRPITNEVPNLAPGDFQPVPNPGLMATAEWVAEHLKDPNVRLVDTRSAEEFRGERVLGPRGGHLPGAANIDWTRALTPGDISIFLDAAQLEQLFAPAQITRDQEVVSYCQSGMRAAQIYFVLRLLGYERVRIYDGSWAEWSVNPALPIEK